MTISFQDALSWLEQNPNATVAEIRDLVSQVSAEVPNAKVTLLYSGKIGDINAFEIAESMGANTEGVATIGKTDVASLLRDPSFRGALTEATTREGLLVETILKGEDASGTRITNDSLWDIASHNFVSNASGDIKTITMNADELSVFSQTEIAALLDNPKIADKKINGVDVSDLKSIYAENGLDAFKQAIKESSAANSYKLETGTVDGQFTVGSDKFLDDVDGVTGTTLPDYASGVKSGSKLLSTDTEWKAFTKLSDSVFNKAVLTKLGVAGDLLSLNFAIDKAEAAIQVGDTATAQDIMGKWSADFLGGVVGGVAAVALVSPLIVLLAPGAIVAGSIIIAAGIAGGIYGGEAGTYLYEKAKEMGVITQDELRDDLADFTEAAKGLLNNLSSDVQTIGFYMESALFSLTRAEAMPEGNNSRYDPLTLDLDGDGVELVSINKSTAFFDLDNDGLREKVGWVKADDGILVLDANNNNSVDNITELFGYRTAEGTQVTGTEELRTHDLNNSGKIDASDAVFGNLKLWQDYNQNGISEEGEMKTLSDLGITSINVAPGGVTELNQFVEGNVIISESTYTKNITNADGSITELTRDYANLDLAIDQTNSSSYSYLDEHGNEVTYDLNLDVLSLPFSRGYGNVESWHVATT